MFSKLMRPLVKLWRSKGLKVVTYMYMYLVNGICAVKGKIHVEAKKASAWARDALECAGLVVHEGKSVWFPSLSKAWLGFDADLEQGCVSVPEAKLAALRAMLQITGVATHLNVGFIILPLTIEVREKVERNYYLASAVLMKANIPQNIQYDVN